MTATTRSEEQSVREGKDKSAVQGKCRIFRCRIVVFRAFSEDSLVVTHPTTNSPACGLSTAERTGSPVFHTLWSYVSGCI
ncbi:uncharacterized protein N7487_009468 [Penicillium crustosum]|uniref:uncharacterized protein n=1 Tax=Penicillium crustosum TaxID=36656 RepID=UPI00238857E8|nr:uncharacterized protein N7487_009468 [Penicillium crustosum]KAJ5395165.1 hypothetical protein N7487_009468 [Penicillium crustosum]